MNSNSRLDVMEAEKPEKTFPRRTGVLTPDRLGRVLSGKKFDPEIKWLVEEMKKFLDPPNVKEMIERGDFPSLTIMDFKTEAQAKNFGIKVSDVQYDFLHWGTLKDKGGRVVSPTKRKPYYDEAEEIWCLDIVRVTL